MQSKKLGDMDWRMGIALIVAESIYCCHSLSQSLVKTVRKINRPISLLPDNGARDGLPSSCLPV